MSSRSMRYQLWIAINREMVQTLTLVLQPDGKTHVLTGLEKAPPSGIAAINYSKYVLRIHSKMLDDTH